MNAEQCNAQMDPSKATIVVALIAATGGIIAAAITVFPLNVTLLILIILITLDCIIYYFITRKSDEDSRKSDEDRSSTRKLGIKKIVIVICFNISTSGVFYSAYFYYIRTNIEITYPHHGGPVDIYETVLGKVRNVPEKRSLWIVVYSHPDKKYYPHSREAVISKGVYSSSFTSADTLIGAPEDVGQKFDIIALLVSEEGRAALQDYFNAPERSGLSSLPQGETYNLITVTRKSQAH